MTAKRVQIQSTAPSERILKARSHASAESRARAFSTMRHVCRRTWIEACVRGAECDFTGEDDARKPFYAFGRESKG